MGNKFSFLLLVASFAICSAAFASSGSGQPAPSANTSSTAAAANPEAPRLSHRLGIGFKTSLLGFGADVALPVTRRSNVRVGFSALNYGRGFDKDGVSYSGKLGLNSVQALYDIFPFGGGFHISPGALIYNGNQLSGKASVPVDSHLASAEPITSVIRPILFPEMEKWRSAKPDQCS